MEQIEHISVWIQKKYLYWTGEWKTFELYVTSQIGIGCVTCVEFGAKDVGATHPSHHRGSNFSLPKNRYLMAKVPRQF